MFIERLVCLRAYIRQLSLEFADQCFVKSKNTWLKTTRFDPFNSASASDADPVRHATTSGLFVTDSLFPATQLRGVIEAWESEGSIERFRDNSPWVAVIQRASGHSPEFEPINRSCPVDGVLRHSYCPA